MSPEAAKPDRYEGLNSDQFLGEVEVIIDVNAVGERITTDMRKWPALLPVVSAYQQLEKQGVAVTLCHGLMVGLRGCHTSPRQAGLSV